MKSDGSVEQISEIAEMQEWSFVVYVSTGCRPIVMRFGMEFNLVTGFVNLDGYVLGVFGVFQWNT